MTDLYKDLMHEDLSNLFYGYGLDFGTFRSMMAIRNLSRPTPDAASYEKLSLRNGIPSLFWYNPENGQEYVCDEVLDFNGLYDDPEGICSSVKMKLEDSSVILHKKSFSPQDIALKEIIRILSVSHEAFSRMHLPTEYTRLVVGVPVRFGARRRQILKDLMEKATGGKEILLLSEPIAAALTYSLYARKDLNKVLVYDLGAGTFDTVLLMPNLHRTRAYPYLYRTFSPDGLDIAGDSFDLRMVDLILSSLRKSGTSLDLQKLSDSRYADYQKLIIAAQEIKERLSSQMSCSSVIEGTDLSGKPGYYKVTVSRAEFENAIKDDLQKTVDCAYHVLENEHLENDPDIDILLVGGSTYIPLVRQLIEKKFLHLDKTHILQRFPEQAIALGCSIYAGDTAATDASVAFGYAIGSRSLARNQDVLDVQIPSNASLPYTFTRTYRTANDRQETIHFRLFEVEHAEAGTLLDIENGTPTSIQITHYFGKAVPYKTPVELTVTLSKDGLLTFTIDDHGITPVDVQTANRPEPEKGYFL